MFFSRNGELVKGTLIMMMQEARYMASVCVNDVSVFDECGNDLQTLIISLMTHLDTENIQASGKIVDNCTAETVYRCRKVMCE